MSDALLSAIIAGVVSIIGAIISYYVVKGKILSDEALKERELERRLTERLYDLRIAYYPKGFIATELLRRATLNDLSIDQMKEVLDKLVAWKAQDSSFIMSEAALRSFFALRDALSVVPDNGEKLSENQLQTLWHSKNEFRKAMTNDLRLLFQEDNHK